MPWLIANGIALALYVAATALHVRRGLGGAQDAGHARFFAGVGVAMHVGGLLGEAASGLLPGFGEALSALSLGVMLAYVLVGRDRLAALGVFLLPVATILQVASFLVPSSTVSALTAAGHGTWWLPIHLGLVFAGFAGFFLELCVAGMQTVVRNRLKRKQFADLARLPALEALELVQMRALMFGLACLGLGVIVGAVGASTLLEHAAWIEDPKVVISAVVWCWYAALFQFRSRMGWQGRHSLTLSAIGFGTLVFSFLALPFVVQGFHAYGV